jgi:signal transduction histidine kinase
MNLLDNAIKYTPPGGVVRLSLARQPAQFLIEVANTSEGIPLAEQPRIFDRFHRVDKARGRDGAANGGGAGLGLAIARRIAEAHGGALSLVHSGPTGPTFAIALPLQPA